ncbi:putative methyltransferase-domain-containing protein [Infundibulicybe gibba]|nr:putative methyltransferase-domain-containing protein [Infundibulicybe gibba]
MASIMVSANVPPPTSRLPPIRGIESCTADVLSQSLHYLRLIYSPNYNASLDQLRSDAFERAYAIKWLTHLISLASDPAAVSAEDASLETLIHDGAALLAICAGTASAGTHFRDFVFSSPRSGPIAVRLKDVPLDNHDFGSVGAQTWGGACVLSEMIVDEPANFGLSEGESLRILELGAGTGLVSLTTAKLMESMMLETTIVATDYYPSVLRNLADNIHSNVPVTSAPSSVTISAHALDWSTFAETRSESELEFNKPFDLVLGADIIYEKQHAIWIKSCLTTLLRRPSLNSTTRPEAIFHLVIPLRATHTSESGTIEAGLAILFKDILICDAESGRDGDVVEYAYYKIGWW